MTGTLVRRTTKKASEDAFAFWSMPRAEIDRSLGRRDTTEQPGPPRAERLGHFRAVQWLKVIGRQFLSPITAILAVAALVAIATGDLVDGSIILGIVVCSALLGSWQEGRAADAVATLLHEVQVTVHLRRSDRELDVPVAEVLPRDEIALAAGDVIPGDCLLLTAHDLSIDESALTGESLPTAKHVGPVLAEATPLGDRTNSLFAGTHVISGTGSALVVLTGAETTFGHITTSLAQRTPETSFETGVRRFGMLLLRVMLLLVGVILLINLLLHRSLVDSLLFALALAVGITPQMLPVVVTVSLAAGARRMARNQVIVKRLDVIEDLGAMSVLCTDKTGTITAGVVGIDHALDAGGALSASVLEMAVLNAGLQTGYPNPLDAAIVARSAVPDGASLLGEVPYDFLRKRLSVVAQYRGTRTLITKGALDSVLGCCTSAAGKPLGHATTAAILDRARVLGQQGFRVLGLAARPVSVDEAPVDITSERDLVFEGMLAFHDPVKAGVHDAIVALSALGVGVKVISGDNRDVTGSLASVLGLAGRVVLGEELERANDAELRQLVGENSLFAEVEPMHKVKVVRALRSNGETVGFLGDGINDAGALHAADVGISVQTAVNVAKEAAGIVLLTQDLGVVVTGVRLGRRTFANTLKYVRVAASSNFGNILSMVIAAALLPFLPMLPAQILLLNFLADIPNTLVSRDRVDRERVAVAGIWNMRSITRFMVMFGALSTVFDLVTFGILEWGFHAHAALFHTAWFVESAVTQFVAMMTLRTSRPAWRSRPDRLFLAVSAAIAVITFALPYTVIGPLLGFTLLPGGLAAILIGVAVLYGFANEGAKRFIRY